MPVRWMGKAIETAEARFRRFPIPLSISGLLFALFLIFSTWLLTLILVKVAGCIHPVLKGILEIVLIYYSISIRSLESSAMAVYGALRNGDPILAKEKLSMIVGRDVAPLSDEGVIDEGVIRASVETVAENLVDGVISPLFYAAIGGAPLAIAYKMINTLDSMVGYKNEKYEQFGKASARIDDLANYIPARLAGVCDCTCGGVYLMQRHQGIENRILRRKTPFKPQFRLSGSCVCRRAGSQIRRTQLLRGAVGIKALYRRKIRRGQY